MKVRSTDSAMQSCELLLFREMEEYIWVKIEKKDRAIVYCIILESIFIND